METLSKDTRIAAEEQITPLKVMTLKDWNADIERSILAEAERSFGASYLTAPQLRSYLVDPDKRMIYIGNEWSFHAISLLTIHEKGDAAIPEELKDAKRVGQRKITIVHPDQSGLGLCRVVVEKGERWFEDFKIPSFSLHWENASNGGLSMLLEAHDYEPQGLVSKPWFEDSLKRQFSCVDCGNPPCNCDATLYVRRG